MKKQFLIILLLISINAHALSIDEKLTLRILKVSDTLKTVLINRGTEDGLVVGDHAKFFITQGVVARGVVMKTSPSRSIWSMYSISNADRIRTQSVMNLRITEEYRVSDDKTKMIAKDDVPSGVMITDSTPRTELAAEKAPGMDERSYQGQRYYQNLDTSEDSRGGGRGTLGLRTVEVYGSFNYTSFSETEDNGFEGVEATQRDSSELSFSFGLEKYFSDSMTKMRNFSLIGQFDYSSSEQQETDGTETPVTSTNLMGGSIGVNYHFYNDPFSFEKIILFASASFGLGLISTSTEGGSSDSSSDGTYNALSFGGGLKYYTEEGLGLRGQLDFYSRNENSTTDIGNEVINKKSGPRIKFGLSYRF